MKLFYTDGLTPTLRETALFFQDFWNVYERLWGQTFYLTYHRICPRLLADCELIKEVVQVARPLRIEFPGAVYHVTSRGNARQDIYHNEQERSTFLEYLSRPAISC